MFNSLHSFPRQCAGVSRRNFFRLGALTLGSLALPEVLRQQARAGKSDKRTAVIQIFLGGGPGHIDTFDPKPDARSDDRGPYRAINTKVRGVQLSSLFPLLAGQMDKFSILRAVHHEADNHLPARHTMFTGQPAPGEHTTHNTRPAVGAVAAKFHGAHKDGLPAYVGLPRLNAFSGAASLGPGYDPFEVEDFGKATFGIKNLRLPVNLDKDRLAELKRIGATVEGMRKDLNKQVSREELEALMRAAAEIVADKATREALDLEKEKPQVREQYGRNTLGQSLLLARRLMEAGTTFVAVEDHGWDTHTDLKGQLDRKGPLLDRALATLAEDLSQRGLLNQVLVVAFGEFGRSPEINEAEGREHWNKVFSILLAGGGLRSGQVVGRSDTRGAEPESRKLGPEDVLATVYRVLGIDPKQTVPDEKGKPVPLLPSGVPVKELV